MKLPEPRIKIDIETKTFVRFWLILLAIILVFVGLYLATPALIIIFSAAFLAIVLNRPTEFLMKFLKSRQLSAITVIGGVILAIVGALFVVIPTFVQQSALFFKTAPALFDAISKSAHNPLDEFIATNHLESYADRVFIAIQNDGSNFAIQQAENFIGMMGGIVSSLFGGMVIFVLVFLMLSEGPVWMERFWRLVYSDKKAREKHQDIANKIYGVVSGYVNGTIILATISAALTAIGVFVVSLFTPLPASLIFPSAIIMFITAFIPMFGAIIGGALLAILLALFDFPAAVIFMIWFIVYQQIENNIFVPKVFSKSVNISPLVVLISIIIGTYCGGFLGVLICVPVAGVLQILLREWLIETKRISGKRASLGEKLHNLMHRAD